MEKIYRFYNLRKDFNKKQLTFYKMCFTSLLCGLWPDLWPFHRLYCKRSGAPNDRIFPNTPEVSQMVFSVL